MAVCTPKIPAVRVHPCATTHDAHEAAVRPLRIDVLRALVVIRRVPVRYPLPHVPGHIVQVEFIRWIAANRGGAALCLRCRMRKEMRARRIERVAPREALALESAARRAFPLRFGWQSYGFTGPGREPRAVGGGVFVSNERHRMTIAP